MPQITINFDSTENKHIEVFKAEHEIKNKADAVRRIIREFFDKKK